MKEQEIERLSAAYARLHNDYQHLDNEYQKLDSEHQKLEKEYCALKERMQKTERQLWRLQLENERCKNFGC